MLVEVAKQNMEIRICRIALHSKEHVLSTTPTLLSTLSKPDMLFILEKKKIKWGIALLMFQVRLYFKLNLQSLELKTIRKIFKLWYIF